jgi:hypothetical protein
VAFLFENITTEMSLTRKFRAELMLGAHVLDGLEDGLAVFSATGHLVLVNQAYKTLWGAPPSSLAEAITVWQGATETGPGFAALREALTDGEPPSASGAMAGPNGQLLGWTVTGLSGGQRMLRFRPAAAQPLTSAQAMLAPKDPGPALPALSSAAGAD